MYLSYVFKINPSEPALEIITTFTFSPFLFNGLVAAAKSFFNSWR